MVETLILFVCMLGIVSVGYYVISSLMDLSQCNKRSTKSTNIVLEGDHGKTISNKDMEFINRYISDGINEITYQLKSLCASLQIEAKFDYEDIKSYLPENDLHQIKSISLCVFQSIVNKMIDEAAKDNKPLEKYFTKTVVPKENIAATCVQTAMVMYFRKRYDETYTYDDELQKRLNLDKSLNELFQKICGDADVEEST